MSKTGTNLLFLAVGAALGAAVGYIAASDEMKKEINELIEKGKEYARCAAERGREEFDSAVAKGKRVAAAATEKGKSKLGDIEDAING